MRPRVGGLLLQGSCYRWHGCHVAIMGLERWRGLDMIWADVDVVFVIFKFLFLMCVVDVGCRFLFR